MPTGRTEFTHDDLDHADDIPIVSRDMTFCAFLEGTDVV